MPAEVIPRPEGDTIVDPSKYAVSAGPDRYLGLIRVVTVIRPRIGLVMDNTDNFMTSTFEQTMNDLVQALNQPEVQPRVVQQAELQVVELYPYIEYMKYLLPGSIALAMRLLPSLPIDASAVPGCGPCGIPAGWRVNDEISTPRRLMKLPAT